MQAYPVHSFRAVSAVRWFAELVKRWLVESLPYGDGKLACIFAPPLDQQRVRTPGSAGPVSSCIKTRAGSGAVQDLRDARRADPEVVTSCQARELRALSPLRTENLNPNVLTMKSAQYGARTYDAGSLNLARDRRILVQ